MISVCQELFELALHYVLDFIWIIFSHRYYDIGSINAPILKMKTLRLRRDLQGYTANA